MKSFLCLVIIIFAIGEIHAQVTTDSSNIATTDSIQREYGEEILVFVETQPKPAEGYEAFYQYIGTNLKYPQEARAAHITGKVILEFVIEKNGAIIPTNIKVLKSPHPSLSEEAIRLIKKGPKWIGGKHQGIPVRTKKVFPITFKLG